MGIRKTLLILAVLFQCSTAYSKGTVTGTPISDSTRTLEWLNDTLFPTLLLNDYELIKDLYPSKVLIDSFLKEKHPQMDATSRSLRYAKIFGDIHKQYRLFRKKLKKSDFALRRSRLDSTSFGTVILDRENPYCQVTMFCSKKNYVFEIEYIAIQIYGQWCLVEKLAFVRLRQLPKKKKPSQ